MPQKQLIIFKPSNCRTLFSSVAIILFREFILESHSQKIATFRFEKYAKTVETFLEKKRFSLINSSPFI